MSNKKERSRDERIKMILRRKWGEKMNIYEATKRALQEKKCMRESPTARVKVKVEETGTCILVKGWQPTTRELLSESWEITE